MKRFLCALGAFAVAMSVCSPDACGQSPKDLVLVNGRLYTVIDRRPVAQALSIVDGRITRVGSTQEVLAAANAGSRVVDLHGKTVVPGLIDSHGHLISLGFSLLRLNLVGTRSYAEVVDAVAARAKSIPEGQWITGGGWDQNDWPEKSFPNHRKLSRRSPDNPVALTRIDGHAMLLNERAMRVAGISRETADPLGGKIIRDSAGEPTGVLVDNAMGLVALHIPQKTGKQRAAALERALRECLRFGLTGVHHAGATGADIDLFKRFADAGRLNLRIYAMIRGSDKRALDQYLSAGPLIGYGGGMLTVRSVKAMTDGALGSRGAALLAPYADDPGNSGLLIMSREQLATLTERALRAGFQVCTHSIGDRGNRTALNAYADALAAVPKKAYKWDARLRIEHAQVVALEDIPRFAQLGVIPVMQATHATSDMYWAEDRLGPGRIKGAYAWRRFLKAGSRIANGSDFPVESANPLWGFYAAITRQDRKGWPDGGWYPDQRMTRAEALRSFTLDAAYAAFEENEKGSIEPGKLADLVVLSKDIMSIKPPEILKTEVIMTIVGGEIVYRR